MFTAAIPPKKSMSIKKAPVKRAAPAAKPKQRAAAAVPSRKPATKKVVTKPVVKRSKPAAPKAVAPQEDPVRKAELTRLTKRVRENTTITSAFLTEALRERERSGALVGQIPVIRSDLMERKHQEMVQNPTDATHIAKKYDPKVARLDRIASAWKPEKSVTLRATDHTFLSKYRAAKTDPDSAAAPRTKPVSAFLNFSRLMRPRITADHATSNPTLPPLSFGEIGRSIGERWKKLTEEEKRCFIPTSDNTPPATTTETPSSSDGGSSNGGASLDVTQKVS